MKVLMTTDGSSHALTAIVSAARLLRRDDLRLDILCVVPELVYAGRSDAMRNAYTSRSARQSQWITKGAEKILHREGLASRSVVGSGSPADEILKRASNYDLVDLVVVGAHGRDERKQPGLGPVSSRIVQSARCSVMVGRDLSSESSYRVLVPIDGSDAGYEALAALDKYFNVEALDVTLMHVVEMPWTRLEWEPGSEDDEDTVGVLGYQKGLQYELRKEADEIIDRGVRLLEKWNVPATTIIEEGDPALELTSHIEEGNYDVVVVGATGHQDMKHVLLGSVSHKLAWNAPCSVIVVRT